MGMSTPVRISEGNHELVEEMAETTDRSKQEVVDSLLEEPLDDGESELAEESNDIVGRCPHTGEVYTESDVQRDRNGEYVKADLPTHIAVEDLEPVEDDDE